MGIKRFWWEKEEVTTSTRKVKGYIEVENDYSQIYHNIFKYSCNIDDKWALRYLLWLLPQANKNGNIPHSDYILNAFIKELSNNGVKKTPSLGTLRNSFTLLVKHNILIKYSYNNYQLNPAIIWGEEIKDRIAMIEELKKGDINYLPITITEDSQETYNNL
jgi:hypothetical protein